jgi:hypothetical protein
MNVWTSAEDVALPEAMFPELRLALSKDSRGRTSALLPALNLGDLALRDVVVRPAALGLFGQSVLAHAPWEIDWDRGTLILDAPPWAEGTQGAVRLPLRRDGYHDLVTMQIAGRSIDMVLDTGDSVSHVPMALGPTDELHHEWGPTWEGKADASLGPFSLGARSLACDPGIRPGPYGAVGLDILRLYRIRVVPGRELWLRPRVEDVRETVVERVARWDWTRGCAHPGCVEASLATGRAAPMPGANGQLTIVLDMERASPRPVSFVFACGAAREPIPASLLEAKKSEALDPEGKRREVPFPPLMTVSVPVGTRGRTEVPLGEYTIGWNECGAPLLVDVTAPPRDVGLAAWVQPFSDFWGSD